MVSVALTNYDLDKLQFYDCTFGKIFIWSPAEFLSLLSYKEINSLYIFW